MDRTLGEWGRKGIGHWVNGIGEKPIISDRPVLQVINTSQGIVILIWMAYTLLGHRAVKANEVYLIWVIGVIGLHCTMEHHLMEIAYNPFLLAVFAEWGNETDCTGASNVSQIPNMKSPFSLY